MEKICVSRARQRPCFSFLIIDYSFNNYCATSLIDAVEIRRKVLSILRYDT